MKRKYILSAFVLSFFLILAGCSTSAEQKFESYYYFSPDYGIQNKLSKNEYFYNLSEPSILENEEYIVSVNKAYYSESDNRIFISADITVNSKAKEDVKVFFEKYNKAEKPEIYFFAGDKQLKYHSGTYSADSYMSDTCSLDGWFKCEEAYRGEELRLAGEFGELKFSLSRKSGVTELSQLGYVNEENNGLFTIVIPGLHGEKQGIFISTYTDKSVFSDFTFNTDNETDSYFLFDKNDTVTTGKAEKLGKNVQFVSFDDITSEGIKNGTFEYNYTAHLSYDSKDSGSVIIKAQDINETFETIKVNIFGDYYFTVEEAVLNKKEFKLRIIPCDLLKSGFSSMGINALVTYGSEDEVKMIETEKYNYMISPSEESEEFKIRMVVPNIYETLSGKIVLD